MYMKSPVELDLGKVNLSSFKDQEGFAVFYSEQELDESSLRKDIDPRGSYYFRHGLTLSDKRSFLEPKQPVYTKSQVLKPVAQVGCQLTLNGFLTQEGEDLDWLDDTLCLFIDLIDDFTESYDKLSPVYDEHKRVTQGICVRNVRCSSASITYSDATFVTYKLDFVGGEVFYVPQSYPKIPGSFNTLNNTTSLTGYGNVPFGHYFG